MGNLGARLGDTEKEQCRERKESKRSSVYMKGVCGCGMKSPPILVAVRVDPAKKIHIKFVKLCTIIHTTQIAILLDKMQKKFEIAFVHVNEDHQRF